MNKGFLNIRQKVFFIIPNFGKGGAERVLSILLRHLNRNKFYLYCIVYDSQRVYEIPEDIKIYCLNLPGVDGLYKKVVYAIKRIFKIREIINKEKPNVIFSFISTVNLVVIFAWLLLGDIKDKVKLIISVRTFLSEDLKGMLDNVTKLLIKTFYPKADKIIANSIEMKKDLVENFNLPEEKIDVIYNPLDIEKIEKLSEETVEHPWFNDKIPIVINIGSLNKSYQKGHDYLLKTFKQVRKKVHCRLVILGEGEKERELKQLSIDLGISNDVAFLGFQDNPFKFIKKSSVFVLSSRFEGFPNVLFEAMACGVPVVSTRCPSGPEEIITDSVNGLLVPVEDEKKMTEAILEILNNPDIATSLALNAKVTALQFDVKATIANYEGLFISG